MRSRWALMITPPLTFTNFFIPFLNRRAIVLCWPFGMLTWGFIFYPLSKLLLEAPLISIKSLRVWNSLITLVCHLLLLINKSLGLNNWRLVFLAHQQILRSRTFKRIWSMNCVKLRNLLFLSLTCPLSLTNISNGSMIWRYPPRPVIFLTKTPPNRSLILYSLTGF